ncbi:MobF family relaxase [Singulisphaera sp. PoT]|uniref:MobF family relaxase n=1 Tax=Singulisphaera sp. PoT TaxID=3411797 RepID=UPI003BF59522
MLRFNPIKDAKAAESYYARSDGGYYVKLEDLHQEFGGKGAAMLGLSGAPDFEQFRRLLHGLDPSTGEQLTAKLVDHRIAAWDVTASIPKGVTNALEGGDLRIHEALWAAGREAMADLEQLATTRVRKGAKQDDRVTGNLVWYGVEHAETRPAKEDGMPDMDRHIHFVIYNLSHDAVEGKWKAVKFRPIMDKHKLFSLRFDMRLADKLVELGYSVQTEWKADSKGGAKYYSWDIKGIPQSAIAKSSRRSKEVEDTEKTILAERQEAAEAAGVKAPEQLSALERDKLGATSRQHKREGLTLETCREYWQGKLTPEEKAAIAETIERAEHGGNARPSLEAAVSFAMRHEFERRAVVPIEELEITAMQRGMGAGKPEDILEEFRRLGGFTGTVEGVLCGSHRDVQDLESRVIDLVKMGRGTCRPLVPGEHAFRRDFLNAGQRNAVNHILGSYDAVLGVRGKAGTGKTTSLQEAAEAIEAGGTRKVFALAPSTAAVEVLRKDGFADATTVARLLVDTKLQEQIRGNVLFIDEAGLLNLKDMEEVLALARKQAARVVLVGDTAQHSPVGHDALRVLERFSSMKTVAITEIQRQKDADFKAAVAAFSRHEVKEGLDRLDALGGIREIADAGERYRALAAEYLAKRDEGHTVGIIAPTHREGEQVTAVLREMMRSQGRLGTEERPVERLVSYDLSEAMKGEASTYQTGDVVIFHQNARGNFKPRRQGDGAGPRPGGGRARAEILGGNRPPTPRPGRQVSALREREPAALRA